MIKIFKFPELRKKIAFTLFIMVIFRLLAHIPVPGVNIEAVRSFLQGNTLLGLFDLFSGGGFQNFSIVTLSIGPYINISIIFQMLTFMIPALEEMQKEGEQGREKINTYTKLLTIPMAFIQAYGIYFLLNRQGVLESLQGLNLLVFLMSLTCGTMILIWIGDLVTEYGIGNGISLLIFVGIISRLPSSAFGFFATLTPADIINALVFAALSVIVIMGVVLINEGTRNISIEYGRRGVKSRKVTNFLPLKINQAGVIPIIFAVSVVMMPSMLSGPLLATSSGFLQSIGEFLAVNFDRNAIGYNILYFSMVVGFTYFYTSIQFNPEKISDDIKKRGGFVPGIRPGKATARYLKAIVDRITLAGALFLGLIAILPFLVQSYTGASNMAIGGTGLLIVVSVVLETIRQIESLTVARSYESFLK